MNSLNMLRTVLPGWVLISTQRTSTDTVYTKGGLVLDASFNRTRKTPRHGKVVQANPNSQLQAGDEIYFEYMAYLNAEQDFLTPDSMSSPNWFIPEDQCILVKRGDEYMTCSEYLVAEAVTRDVDNPIIIDSTEIVTNVFKIKHGNERYSEGDVVYTEEHCDIPIGGQFDFHLEGVYYFENKNVLLPYSEIVELIRGSAV